MQTKLTLKTILPYIIIGILIVIASFFMKGCNDKTYVNAKSDNAVLNDFIQRKGVLIQTIMSNNKTLRDSLFKANKAKIKIVYRTKTVYDSLIINDTSCVNSLVMLYNECQENDSINNVIIDNLSTQNANLLIVTNNQQDVIDMQKYKIKQDSLEKVALNEQLIIQYNLGKKKGRWQGIALGKTGEALKDGLYLYLKK